MNERIFELAEQAGFQNGHQDRDGRSLSGELEKFAELIVRECAEIADESTSRPYESYGEKIRQYFGAEE